MPKYRITLDDGRVMEMTADSPPSEAMVHAQMGDPVAEPQGNAFERFFKPLLPSTTPADYINGPLQAIRHPIDSFNAIKDAVASDPTGAIPVIGNVKRGGQDLREGNYAGAAGETIAGALPFLFRGKANVPQPSGGGGLPGAIGGIGSKMSQIGRGMETAGAATRKPGLGVAAIEGIRNPKAAAITAAVPLATEYLGKGVQKLGGALEGIGGRKFEVDPHMPNTSGYRAGEFGDAAGDFQPSAEHHMPNASGYDGPSGSNQTTLKMGPDPLEVVDPYMANKSGYVRGEALPESLAAVAPAPEVAAPAPAPYEGPVGKLTGRKSPTLNDSLTEAMQGLMDKQPDAAPSMLTPDGKIDMSQFGGERTTGQFEKANGDLNDVAAGNVERHLMPGQNKVPTASIDALLNETPTFPDVNEALLADDMATRDSLRGTRADVPNNPAALELEAARRGASGEPSYTDWSSGMDDIINGATEGDFPPRKGGFLSNSKPTRADQAGLDLLRRLNGAAGGIK